MDQRLARLYGAVQQNAALPVIVTTRSQPTAATLNAAQRAGAGPARVVSLLGNAYATTATAQVAAQLANMPDTIGVFYDEPVTAAG